MGRTIFIAGLLLLSWLGAPAPARGATDSQTILHMLDYIGADYRRAVADGRVKNLDEYEEQKEFAADILARLQGLPERPAKAALIRQARELAAAIGRLAPADEIATLTRALSGALIQAYDVSVAPRRAPDLGGAQALFTGHCAACHGASGDGDGPLAARLDPPPTDFRNPDWQAARSVYGLYNTITLGVAGTAMRGFSGLSAEQRWALAFYVSTLADTDALREQGAALWAQGVRGGFRDLAALTSPSAAQVYDEQGADGLALFAYLRAHPERLNETAESPLAFAMRTLAQSMEAYRAGNRDSAERLAVAAYLEGFELVENGLRAVDAALAKRIEDGMAKYRGMIRQRRDAEPVVELGRRVIHWLDEARERLGASSMSPGMSFASSFIILLREGLEAILVLAAIGAFLVKAGRRDALTYIHRGWTAALLLGGVTWYLASHVVTVSGAGREMTEGVAALTASAMLLYVGYWLHNKSHAMQWQAYIDHRLSAALGRGSLWGLTLIAFLAVYREVFETVLFYQTLWLQTGPAGQGALLGGLGTAAVVLVGLAWLIFRFSIRLPLRLFFSANSLLLFLLAVVFAGKGVAALQEAGKLPIDPVDFPRIDWLGVYPSLESLLAQGALIALALFWLAYQRLAGRRRTSINGANERQ